MRPFNPDAWKKPNFDPDFNVVVKTFLGITRQIKDITDDWVFAVKDELLPILINNQGRQLSYDGKELLGFLGLSQDDFLQDVKIEIEKFLKLNGRKKLLYIQRSKRHLLSVARRLPASGKKFYYKKIESLFNGTLLKPITGLSEKDRAKIFKSNLKECISITSSLMCRFIMRWLEKLFQLNESEVGNEER